TFVNTQLEHLFGYASGELIGKQLEILVPAAIRKNHPELRDSYFDKPMPRYMGVGRDLSGTRKDGSEIPVEIALNPIQTAEGVFAVAAVTDITERKRAEERFRAVVQSAPNAMVMIDDTGVINLTNNQADELFGYEPNELLGQPIEVLVPKRIQSRHPELRSGF